MLHLNGRNQRISVTIIAINRNILLSYSIEIANLSIESHSEKQHRSEKITGFQ